MPDAGPGLFPGECLARAQVFIAEESSLGPKDFDGAGDGDVAQALVPAGMNAGADHAAGWAAGLGGGFDADPLLFEGEDLSVGDAVVGQVENGGGSIGAWGSRLDQGS